jgi:hypothetical protein
MHKHLLNRHKQVNNAAYGMLGPDAVKLVAEKLDALKAEIETYRGLSMSTQFDYADKPRNGKE